MSIGNPGSFSHIRSRRSHRVRVALTILSIVLGVTLLVLSRPWDAPGIMAQVAFVEVLLVAGIVFGLRPWSGK